MMYRVLSVILIVVLASCSDNATEPENKEEPLTKGNYRAPKAATAPQVDGVADDAAWEVADWAPIDVVWLGTPPEPSDFSGQYKVVWTANRLYVLVDITDNQIVDKYRDPLVNYWNDDCLEIFLDEDRSKGDHTYNYNAFAYHISYERHVVDIAPDRQPRLYDDHVLAQWKGNGSQITWELGIDVYDDTYQDDGSNTPVPLKADKTLGFMVAYCDADGQSGRESFIGSIPIAGPDKNLGWQDASVFGELTLVNK